METAMATKAPWCAVTARVEVIGGRWRPTILFHILGEANGRHRRA
jgi:DNA-binding HxlR family transcriptional regulator